VFLALAFGSLAMFAVEVSAQVRVAGVNFASSALVRLHIPNNESVMLLALAGAAPSDPAGHLYREVAPGEFEQVEYDDNSGPDLSSLIVHTNTSGAADYLYLVRSRSWATGGTVTLYVWIGSSAYAPVTMEVRTVLLPSTVFVQGAEERMHTAELPGGSLFPAVFPVAESPWPGSADPYSHGLNPALTGGVGGAVIAPAADLGGYMFLTPQILEDDDQDLVWELVESRSGWGSVYINDFQDDTDGDGLGDLLEDALGTCSGVGTCPYAGNVYPFDTDRDGLTDGEEVLGAVGSHPNGYDDISFPRWGSNPLHKDMFIQFNYILTETNPHTANPFLSADPNLDSWVDSFADLFAAAPHFELLNPDEEDGLAVHLDVGIPPADPNREALYGDYSSMYGREEPPFWVWEFEQPVASWNGELALVVQTAQYFDIHSFLSTDPSPTTPIGFATYLFNIIKNVIPAAWGVVGTLSGAHASVESEDPAEAGHLEAYLFCKESGSPSWTFCSLLGLVEESRFLNAARFNHYHNSYYVDAVRVGRFYYASVVEGGGGQGPQPGRTVVAGMSDPTTPAHEFGHCLGLSHGGSPHPGYEGRFSDCPPNYDSVMNYVNGPSFYSGTDSFPMNPANVSDQYSLPNDPCKLATHLNVPPWHFETDGISPPDSCHIDWNRSGGYEPDYYQAPVGMAESQSCRAFVQKDQKLVTDGHQAQGFQAIARGGGFLYVFSLEPHTTGNKIVYRRAPLGSMSADSCTGGIESCLSFSSPVPLVDGAFTKGLSAYFWKYQMYPQMFLAYFDSSTNRIHVRRYSILSSGSLRLNQNYSNFYNGELIENTEFVVKYDGTSDPRMSLIWSGPFFGTGAYVEKAYNHSTNTWSSSQLLVDCQPQPQMILGNGTPAAVAWPDPYNTVAPYGFRRTCSILPDSDRAARLFCYDPVGSCWEDLTSQAFPPAYDGPGIAKYCPGVRSILSYGSGDVCVPRAVKPLDLVFVPQRYSTGNQVNPSAGVGNLYLVYYGVGSCPAPAYAPAVWISEAISSSGGFWSSPLWSGDKSRHWHDYTGNQWSCLQEQGNYSLYVDEMMGSAMAAGAYFVHGKSSLQFYPFADGSPNVNYWPISDFLVMEGRVCASLKGSASPSFCE
jgi:hypothetical protein